MEVLISVTRGQSADQIEVHLDGGAELVDKVLGCVDRDLKGPAVAPLRQYTATDHGVHVESGEEVAEGPAGKRAQPGAVAKGAVGVIGLAGAERRAAGPAGGLDDRGHCCLKLCGRRAQQGEVASAVEFAGRAVHGCERDTRAGLLGQVGALGQQTNGRRGRLCAPSRRGSNGLSVGYRYVTQDAAKKAVHDGHRPLRLARGRMDVTDHDVRCTLCLTGPVAEAAGGCDCMADAVTRTMVR